MKTIFSVCIEEFNKKDNSISYIDYTAYYETKEEAQEDFEKQKSNFNWTVENGKYWEISISECTIDENKKEDLVLPFIYYGWDAPNRPYIDYVDCFDSVRYF